MPVAGLLLLARSVSAGGCRGFRSQRCCGQDMLAVSFSAHDPKAEVTAPHHAVLWRKRHKLFSDACLASHQNQMAPERDTTGAIADSQVRHLSTPGVHSRGMPSEEWVVGFQAHFPRRTRRCAGFIGLPPRYCARLAPTSGAGRDEFGALAAADRPAREPVPVSVASQHALRWREASSGPIAGGRF